MNRRVLVLVASFFACIVFMVYAENVGWLKETKHKEEAELVRSSEIEIPVEIKNFKASPDGDDSALLSGLFSEVTDYTPPNKELQVYMGGQTEVVDNRFIITAEHVDDQYFSGKLESQIAFRYGTFSFRVNTMNGKGLFPAIWLMPSEGNLFPELDIYELIGSEPEIFYGVLHYYKNDMQKRNFFQHKFSSKKIPDSYEIKLDWTPEELTWYLNGKKIHSVTDHVPQVPMFMNINLAIGGIWPGKPDSSTPFPAKFNVDILEFNVEEAYSR